MSLDAREKRVELAVASFREERTRLSSEPKRIQIPRLGTVVAAIDAETLQGFARAEPATAIYYAAGRLRYAQDRLPADVRNACERYMEWIQTKAKGRDVSDEEREQVFDHYLGEGRADIREDAELGLEAAE